MSKTVDLDALLDAALAHVAFDGWTQATFDAAAADLGIAPDAARGIAPRGAIDLAVAFHRRGDRAMLEALESTDLSDLRYSEKVAKALELRIKAMTDREAVRRATTLFALPTNAPEGARLVWETADHVWNALGDTSTDGNWYTKRATLSAVWASTVLFWLGDDSPLYAKTFEFIDRRIDNVMQIEKLKGQVRANPLMRPLARLEASVMAAVKPPRRDRDVPGYDVDTCQEPRRSTF